MLTQIITVAGALAGLVMAAAKAGDTILAWHKFKKEQKK